MFHRVNIRKADQNSQRFLWREGDPTKLPDVYVMTAMIFGSICSLCSAQYVKNFNASKFLHEYPRAVEAIIDRHYVDDYVGSFSSVHEAISVTKKVVAIHQEAGFELRGFISNSNALLQAIYDTSMPVESPTKNMCSGESDCEKVLGMHWDPNRDAFSFKLMFARIPNQVLDGSRRPTKAELLGIIMSIFDPFGFLSNITLAPKILLQKLWQLSVDWHEAIPREIHEVWFQWYKSLESLSEFSVPRCYHLNFTDPSTQIQLHIFVDASELAYAAVAYWRICHANEVEIVFIVGKSRCSPLKPLSIPRLELQSAVLGTKIKSVILGSHTVQPDKIVFWSDSKTVIQWIRSEARRYKQFVCNRISEILQSSEVSQWRWVPGSLNPADDATRPQKVRVSSNSRWISGPSYLNLSEDQWPVLPNPESEVVGEEEKQTTLIIIHF
ncbi:PREDICTED: uncharacterized protein LOC108361296 [Rhagoletis zephyria]|uniref:uncharacterized protein LOC108361296 n=1 Tax=Rhagoletis zephyria TaxID=28612 RepID=UPI0008112E00|nr:PREDICTED: uncharacterized protein LOC108361296 [Rhagoletis zephyria]